MSAAVVKEFPLTFDNPATGERFELRTSARSGDGRFRFRWTLAPGRTGPPEHSHPVETESFTLVAGTLEAWIDGSAIPLEVGRRVSVPPNTLHRFRNPGSTAAVVEVELDGTRLEDTLVGNAVHFGAHGATSPLALGRVMLHDVTYGASRFRSPLVRWMMRAIAAGARLLGLRPFPVPEDWASRPAK